MRIIWALCGALAVISPLPAETASTQNKSLQETLDTLEAQLYWDSFFQSGMFSSGGHNASFETGEAGKRGPVLFDNKQIFDLPVPFVKDGKLTFPAEFVVSLKQAFENSRLDDASHFKIAAIMIDPGHGGKDTGATGNHVFNGEKVTLVEKEITLTVSKELYLRLQAAFPDKKILISRTGDSYPTLQDRVAMANSVALKDTEAIIYISIHANASFNKTARGFEVWYLTPEHNRTVINKETEREYRGIAPIINDILQEEYNRESLLMASAIHRRISETFGAKLPSRGLKAEDFFVVRKALMPSVLVELAFVTNEADARLLANEDDLKKFAGSIYNGIMDFVRNFEQSGGYIATP
ncbi:MAG: N-acetylmuramoyl-L-alanine amidase [Spirochaetaceae bacterium]|jgi:N-acetylmuramoyl-L-alanine amidase|nr:N-acetylmuramoyl-L-alanine amidase [Spirochaetaceae bacterium]